MTNTRPLRRRTATILLTGTLLGTSVMYPAWASERASTPPPMSASQGGGSSDADREASRKGSFDITKKGSFDPTKKGSFDVTE
jgi:hypothetical protein